MKFKRMSGSGDKYCHLISIFVTNVLLALLCVACGDDGADDFGGTEDEGDEDEGDESGDLTWQDVKKMCNEATTRAECDMADDELGKLEAAGTFVDRYSSCDWIEYRPTRIENGECLYGESVGKCQIYSYGEFGGDLYPAVCDAAGYGDRQLYVWEIEGETYLSLEYREEYNSSALRCDESSSEYSPYCGCLCQADSPFMDEAVICDQQYPTSCVRCVNCSYDAQCAFIVGKCHLRVTCGAFEEALGQLTKELMPGSSEWLAVYDSVLNTFVTDNELDEAEIEVLEDAYQREFVCKYCSACGLPCTSARPACERWASLYSD
ncbi:MAG: hypothetical protein JXX14_23115 [Deltaproteobacteria bacterium]|nr:hypothetical protein [Deltaproteobacteria bacterium]